MNGTITVLSGARLVTAASTAIDEGLIKLSSKPKVLLGEVAAKSTGIEDGDEIKLETKNGSISVLAAVTRRAADNTVIVPVNHPDLDAWPLFAGLNAGLSGRVSKA